MGLSRYAAYRQQQIEREPWDKFGLVSNLSFGPIASYPWAGLGVASEPPSAGRVNASCEGQRHCAPSLCQRGNISAHSRRRLGEAILCRTCSESYVSHVAAPPARERAYIAMCIEDKRNRRLRS